jgi:hypothetical protein
MTRLPVFLFVCPAANRFRVRLDARGEQIPDMFEPALDSGARKAIS